MTGHSQNARIHHAQGFLFSRPLPATAVEKILEANQPLGPSREESAAARKDSEPFYASVPFEWPAHVPTRATAVDQPEPSLVGRT